MADPTLPPLPPTVTNLVSMFLHAQGHTKVPLIYYQWACLSMLAASVGDRVWLERTPGRRIRPNLYLMLIGPSGVGKGDAIREVVDLAGPVLGADIFFGRTTAEGLRDRLGKPERDGQGLVIAPPNPRVWLLHEELAFSVGTSKTMADELVALLVEIYGGNPAPLRDRTRTGGEIVLHSPCVNWCAGTTSEWLAKAMSADAVAGGLARRLCAVEAGYSEERLPDPIYPPDRDAVRRQVRRRLAGLVVLEGEFEIEPAARRVFLEWFESRPPTDDPLFRPWWETQDELAYKLAMLLALAERPVLRIEGHHMHKAWAWTTQIQEHIVSAIQYAALTTEKAPLALVRMLIKQKGWIGDRELSQRLAGRGILAKEKKEYLETLTGAGEVVRFANGPRGGTWWQWQNPRRGKRTGPLLVAGQDAEQGAVELEPGVNGDELAPYEGPMVSDDEEAGLDAGV